MPEAQRQKVRYNIQKTYRLFRTLHAVDFQKESQGVNACAPAIPGADSAPIQDVPQMSTSGKMWQPNAFSGYLCQFILPLIKTEQGHPHKGYLSGYLNFSG